MNTSSFGPRVNVFDVTAPMTAGLTVWPGDPAFALDPTSRIANGDSCNVSKLSTSTHAGTHVDAPWHFEEDGQRLDDIAVERWIGRCHVIDAGAAGSHVSVADLEGAAIPDDADRLLVRTRSDIRDSNGPFDTAYTALSPEAASWLVARDFALVGIDAPSVAPYNDPDDLVHHTLLQAGVLLVEGLKLTKVDPGPYLLVCLPLRLLDADGSPARALLMRES